MPTEPDLVDAYLHTPPPSIMEDLECPRCGITRITNRNDGVRCYCDKSNYTDVRTRVAIQKRYEQAGKVARA